MARSYSDICPYKDCVKRKVGCHSSCPDYNNWKKNGAEIKTVFFESNNRRKKKK